MNRQEFLKLLQNEPLVHAVPTMAMTHPLLFEHQAGSIYYGTGLSTPRAASIGLPFDVLILVLVAEKLRKALGLKAIHHHIADTHALTNSFCTSEGVAAMATQYREVLGRIAEVTGIPLQVHLSSEFDRTDVYHKLLDTIVSDKAEYVRRELADMLWYRRQHNVHLKLGWLVQATETKVGFDERLYDREFLARCDYTMSFAYVVAGRTLDPKRPKASPYISVAGEGRVLFTPGQNVREMVEAAIQNWAGDKKLGGVIQHWNAILRLWDRVSKTPAPKEGDVIDRVQALIDIIVA